MASGRETEASPPAAKGRLTPGRRRAIRIIAAIMAASAILFGLFTAVFGIVGEGQEIHALHNAVVASLLLVLSAPPAVAVARAPERSMRPRVMLAALGIAALGTMALGVTIDPYTLPFVVLTGVLWALSSDRERPFGEGRPSPVLLAVAVVAVAPLIAYALGQAGLQRTDATSEHAELFHWVEAAFYAAAIAGYWVLAALAPAAYRLAAWTASVALAVLGAVSLAFPAAPSAVDRPWAWAAVAGGVVFAAVARWEASRRAGGRIVHAGTS